jgi:hypothetical protein
MNILKSKGFIFLFYFFPGLFFMLTVLSLTKKSKQHKGLCVYEISLTLASGAIMPISSILFFQIQKQGHQDKQNND